MHNTKNHKDRIKPLIYQQFFRKKFEYNKNLQTIKKKRRIILDNTNFKDLKTITEEIESKDQVLNSNLLKNDLKFFSDFSIPKITFNSQSTNTIDVSLKNKDSY